MLGTTIISFLATTALAITQRQSVDRSSPTAAFGLNPTRPTNMTYQIGDRSMVKPINLYIIWYGNWKSEEKSIITDFLSGLDQSGFWNVATKYYQQLKTTGKKTHVTNTVQIKGQADDHYSMGTYINNSTDTNINDLDYIIQTQISAGHLPSDLDGFYVVLGDKYTIEGSSCSQYCGYHGSVLSDQITGSENPGYNYNAKQANYVYTWVGNAAACGPNGIAGCGAPYSSPNGNAAIDAMLSPLAHELAEGSSNLDVYSTTSGHLSQGWLNSVGENGDNCAYVYGSSRHYDANGDYYYNNEWNGRKYNIQQLWDPETQLCGPVNHADIPDQCQSLKNLFPSLNYGDDCCNSGFADCADGQIVAIDISSTNQVGDIGQLVSQIQTSFPSLEQMFLGGNNFTGVFPESLCEMTNLKAFSLSALPINGTLPECLVNLTKLQTLSAHGSHLTGPIPSKIFENNAPLKAVHLASNNFTGNIPASLAAKNTITDLDISKNMGLSGPIPSGFRGFNGKSFGPTDNSGPVVLCTLAATNLCLPAGYSGPTCGLQTCSTNVSFAETTSTAPPDIDVSINGTAAQSKPGVLFRKVKV